MIPFPFRRSDYHYPLLQEQIAQHPCRPRDHSRLLRVDRASGTISEMPFYELAHHLQSGDHLIYNDAKVLPARLLGTRSTGGAAEILLTRCLGDGRWEAIGKPTKALKMGARVTFSETLFCEVVDLSNLPTFVVQFYSPLIVDEEIARLGKLPLPPYIKRAYDAESDDTDYQTFFAKEPGAVATPAAGLHFTPTLLEALHKKGVTSSNVTLDIASGTFKPVHVDDIRTHPIHTERYFLPETTACLLRNPHQVRSLICVGTTSCRVVESSSRYGFVSGPADTNLFIYPGYTFKTPYSLITNFHAPESTLLMLTCAFAGYDLIMRAYDHALKSGFRFLSFGDAMWIV